jgi:aryl-alcohol dehydrogenase-like predicted oxidoreductase
MSAPTTFRLGGELDVHRIGFGAMRLTGQPGNFGPYADWDAGKILLREAATLGVDFFDSAHAYGPVHNERLLGEAFAERNDVVLATKGGIEKFSPTQLRRDASPAALRRQVETSLQALRHERIDLYQLHWVDPQVPIEDSVGALARLRDEGKIRLIGLSNIGRAELDRARAVAAIASVQNRYNRIEREHDALIDYTRELGIAFVPYGPLGAHPMQPGAPLAARGDAPPRAGRTPAQEALRWLLDRSPNIVVIPGTTSLRHLRENVAS